MSQYFVNRRAGSPNAAVAAAVSFLLVSCAIFMSALITQYGPETIASAFGKQFRHWAVSLGWATPYVSLRLPPRRVASLPLPPKSFEQQIARLSAPKMIVPTPQPVIIPPLEKQPAPKPVVIVPNVAPKIVPKSAAKSAAKAAPKAAPKVVQEPRQRMAAVDPKQLPPKFKSSIAPQPSVPKRAEPKPVPQSVPMVTTKPAPATMPKSALLPPTHKVPPAKRVPPTKSAPPITVTPEVPAPKKPDSKLNPKLDYAELVKQAKAGVASAQLALAQHYHTGEGVSLSNIKALFWFHQAAKQGVANAQLSLGMIYYVGDGVPKNPAKAYRWIKLAAAQDNAKAITVMKALHRSMPSPLFTSLVFPEPIILEPEPIVISSQTIQPQPITNAVSAEKKQTVKKPAVSPWKPDVFVLGNKPLP